MSESFGEVTVTAMGRHVAEVELHRPPANYFNAALLEGIVDSIRWADRHGCRAVVLCSEGRHFCAGLEFGTGPVPQSDALGALYRQAVALVSLPLPVVVAVQGAAVGGGLGLAMAGDFRIGAPDSRFSANFAQLGIHQGFGLSVTLPRAIGHQRALDLLTTGRRITGEEAYRIGVCDRLAEDPRAEAHRLAGEIAGSAPLAVRSIRATLRAGLVDEFTEAVHHERSEQVRLLATEDSAEGIAASAARRAPRFTGR